MKLSRKHIVVSGLVVVAVNYVCYTLKPFMQQCENSHNGEGDIISFLLFISILTSFVAAIYRIIENKKIDRLSFMLIILGITCIYWINIFSGLECVSCTKV